LSRKGRKRRGGGHGRQEGRGVVFLRQKKMMPKYLKGKGKAPTKRMGGGLALKGKLTPPIRNKRESCVSGKRREQLLQEKKKSLTKKVLVQEKLRLGGEREPS